MLSRTADSLFWMNRYMERADSMMRIIKTNYTLSLDAHMNRKLNWSLVLELFTSMDSEDISAEENDTSKSILRIISDIKNNNSFKAIVNRARENARGIQDYITKEVWEQINQLYHIINKAGFDDRLKSFNAMETIDLLTGCLVMYTGVTELTMPRGVGWSFMNLGKLVERCFLTIEMSDKQFSQINYELSEQQDILYWRFLLLSLSGYELNLKNYRTQNHNQNVLHQVLFNSNFNRALIYSLNRIERHLNYIITESNYTGDVSVLHSFGRLFSIVKFTDFEHLNGEGLRKFFVEVKEHLQIFVKLLEQHFFSYS